jgi:hypothetical protein
MILRDRREFGIGVALVAVFVAALALVFRPMLDGGRNVLDYLDGVFNSTSKASAYYIPAARERARKLGAAPVSAKIVAKGPRQAAEAEALFRSAGASASVEGKRVSFSGELGAILAAALADADAMFRNDGASVSRRHGIEGRRALLAWHWALGETVKELNRQQRFREAAAARDVLTKGIEPAYNYYGVTAVAMKDMIWVALAALFGYVLYTVWYGFAILYLFEGWGLKLEH